MRTDAYSHCRWVFEVVSDGCIVDRGITFYYILHKIMAFNNGSLEQSCSMSKTANYMVVSVGADVARFG